MNTSPKAVRFDEDTLWEIRVRFQLIDGHKCCKKNEPFQLPKSINTSATSYVLEEMTKGASVRQILIYTFLKLKTN